MSAMSNPGRIPVGDRRPGSGLFCMLLLLAFFAAGAASASGQQTSYRIQGTVVAATTQQPITSAAVRVAGTQLVALTNQTGRFDLAARLTPGEYQLEIAMLGYASATRPSLLRALPWSMSGKSS